MKKLLFVLFALMVSQPAMAQWVQMGEGSSSRQYYDPTRIESYSGIYQSIWGLNDYNAIQENRRVKKSYRSSVARWVVDCSRKEIKEIGAFWYSENMGKGELVDSNTRQGIFESAPPNSALDTIINLACRK